MDKTIYTSTRGSTQALSFDEAIFQGLAPDGGLYMPSPIPSFDKDLASDIVKLDSYPEVAERLIQRLLAGSVIEKELSSVLHDAFNFEIPLITLDEDQGLYVLELFHGPTLAFKDVGARFMARTFSSVVGKRSERIIILAATSGDTGSAVANGFLGVPNIDVCILYPKGKVSLLQEKQITTNGQNVHALEVDGSFDDCQALVKHALNSYKTASDVHLTTANSINISRLIPQSTYYAWAYAQAQQSVKYIVPSGNFGNITSGIFAHKMGLPVDSFTASVNSNDIVPNYLSTGLYEPKASISTISNAMDVGAPSNFERLKTIYHASHIEMGSNLQSVSISDTLTKTALKSVYEKYGYVMCPHTATAYAALKERNIKSDRANLTVVLATAHPAKFGDTVEEVIGKEIELPQVLKDCMVKEKLSTEIAANYEAFSEQLAKIIG
jgi:threonine synthase